MRAAGNPSLQAWKGRTRSKPSERFHRDYASDSEAELGSSNSIEEVHGERSMVQQVPMACIADTVVTLPEASKVPPGEMHCDHIGQPGHSWDEWPANSLWGAIAGWLLCLDTRRLTSAHVVQQGTPGMLLSSVSGAGSLHASQACSVTT